MKPKARLALFAAIAAAAVVIATSAISLAPVTSLDFSPAPPAKAVDANNQFAMDLYSRLGTSNDSNIFFSPSSVSLAFAIIFEGARGNTADEIGDVFYFSQNDEERRSSFSSMLDYYNNAQSTAYKLQIANALWLAEGFEPREDYVGIAEDHYDSQVDTVDFSVDGFDPINEWVSDKTEGRIEEILSSDSVDPNTMLVIINAIYFKGSWAEQFDKDKTMMSDFYVDEETTVQVPTMELTAHLNLARNDQVQILELPYEGDRLSMLVLLPTRVDGIESVEEDLSIERLNEWTGQLREINTRVQMPKFQLETDYDLIPPLEELGVRDAFTSADFSGISSSSMFIDEVKHKAFVAVDEEGTEAAAATGAAILQSGPTSFTADHPFIFIIQDRDTGQILFMGRVMNPAS